MITTDALAAAAAVAAHVPLMMIHEQ